MEMHGQISYNDILSFSVDRVCQNTVGGRKPIMIITNYENSDYCGECRFISRSRGQRHLLSWATLDSVNLSLANRIWLLLALCNLNASRKTDIESHPKTHYLQGLIYVHLHLSFHWYKDWIWHGLDIHFKHWDAREVHLFLKDIAPSTEAGFWCYFVYLAYHSHYPLVKKCSSSQTFHRHKEGQLWNIQDKWKRDHWMIHEFLYDSELSELSFLFLTNKIFKLWFKLCVCVCVLSAYNYMANHEQHAFQCHDFL